MKKMIALLCALIMLTACCITTNAATLKSLTPNEEIAKEYGYAIEYYLKDGWRTPLYYLDENRCIPNQILFVSNKELDISEYKDGELADFLGVEILNINCAQVVYPELLKYEPNKYDYTITTANFYTPEEVKALFAEYDFISKVTLNAYIMYGACRNIQFFCNLRCLFALDINFVINFLFPLG
ncbi:MAG: hypothetical protein E7586_03235 [Ruminococcaceae bacterium]|nr:hypothetical protein [Oscillospiraceae bacterium]